MNEKEMKLAERIAKILDKDTGVVGSTPLVTLLEKLVEVIERERVSN